MSDADRDLLHMTAFVVFFPVSAIFLVARWLIRKQKALTTNTSGRHLSSETYQA